MPSRSSKYGEKMQSVYNWMEVQKLTREIYCENYWQSVEMKQDDSCVKQSVHKNA